MGKNEIYIFISILVIVSIFASAALCNQCLAQLGESVDEAKEEETTEEPEEEIIEEATEEATEDESSREEEEEEITEEEQTEKPEEEPAEEAPQPEEEEPQQASTISTELNVKIGEVGYLIREEDVLHPQAAVQYIGDTAKNNPCRGYISYDITPLSGATVESALLRLGPPFIGYGNISSFYPINLYSTTWGNRPLIKSDFGLTGNLIGQSYSDNIEIGSDDLRDAIQDAIDNGKTRFQIMFYFTGLETDFDNQDDGLTYSAQAAGNLTVNYIP